VIADTILNPPPLMGREPAQASPLPAAPAPSGGAAVKNEAELRKIASDFESLFSQMLMSSMRKTVQKSPLFHGGRGEEIFSELLDTNYAKSISSRGKGLGIADMIVKKYSAHVKAQADQVGRRMDTGGAPAAVPADEVKRND
jgi:Rod binding domain-containing protein